MAPLLSLVTGAMNRPESFARLVRSIVEHTSVPWELVVSDASDVTLTCDLEQVRILPEKPRLGCVKGFNRAFAAAIGEWVLYLNDDAEVLPNYDREAIRFMESHPEIGLGALHYAEPNKEFHTNEAWNCMYGNFGILSRELGNKVGWFDSDLEMYGNDNSLAFRVLLAGFGIAEISGARIFHHAEKDQNRADNQQYKLRDNKILQHKYMPLRKQWSSVYQRYKLPTTTAPWPSGVRPQVVSA